MPLPHELRFEAMTAAPTGPRPPAMPCLSMPAATIPRARTSTPRNGRACGGTAWSGAGWSLFWTWPIKDLAPRSIRTPLRCAWSWSAVPEALIAVSFSKNLGLVSGAGRYGLIVISENAARADAVQSHMQHHTHRKHLLHAAGSRRGHCRQDLCGAALEATSGFKNSTPCERGFRTCAPCWPRDFKK